MRQIDFYQNSIKLRDFLSENPEILSDFWRDPVSTIRKNSLDFPVFKGEDGTLLSSYLENISAPARQVIISSMMSAPDINKVLCTSGGGDDWIDDVHGGIGVTAVALVNAITTANAVVVVNANVTAQVNAISNANAISNVNTMGFGSAYVNDEVASAKQICIDRDVFSPELISVLSERGLNAYRRSALLKHLAWKYHSLDSSLGRQSTVLAEYKNLKIQIVVDRVEGKWHLVKADLLH
ncbi:hypothetical protein [Burkholderia cepacia]|uniref:hypothetical protein n=1 Tax=Burkholderia cepacia TaxID=292 RepID=UPI002FE2FC2E